MYSRDCIEIITESTILEILSDGKFSRVYLGKEGNSDSTSKSAFKVIKVYPREKSKTRSYRIISEKTVMQRVAIENNPYVAKLLLTTKDNDNLYFVMEAYQCGHLNLHIRESECGRMSAIVTRNYAAEIVSALLSLMKCGCVHRDIKPKNILVDKCGHLKMCDFGSSKILFDTDQHESIILGGAAITPRTFSIIGTKHYMAPEIIAKSCGYSLPVDWWALGVLLFEMLCGAVPTFRGACGLDNESAIELASKGDWPDKVTSVMALNAVRNISPTAQDPSAVSSKDWSPVLTASNAAVLSSSSLHSSAWILIQSLLTPCPEERLGPWNAGDLKDDPFFNGINWAEVDAGVSPPPDLSFNRHLGFGFEDFPDGSDSNADDDHDSHIFEGF
jgi:serine/threonine protein kinase